MDFTKLHAHFASKDTARTADAKTTGWIQWKGTDICMDIHCECGYHGHLDAEFAHYYQCPRCSVVYHPQTTIAMEPVTGAYLDYVQEHHSFLIKTCEDDGE